MPGQDDDKKSMHNRISNILSPSRSEQRNFGTWNQTQAEDAEEIEYLLARAEVELRAAQARVDELKRKLANSQ
jgi:hypothetical protein